MLVSASAVGASTPAVVVDASKPSHGLIAHAHLHHTAHGHNATTDSFNAATAFASAQVQGLAAYSLGRMGAQCKCGFHGSCGCDAALEFMDCIAAACQSGTCECQDGMHFLYACHNMSAVCPTSNLMCTSDSASCFAPDASPQPVDGAAQKAAGTEASPPAAPKETPEEEEEESKPRIVGDGPHRHQLDPRAPGQISAPDLPSPRLPNQKDLDALPSTPEVSMPAPPESLVPVISQRKCFYLFLLLVCFCSCFGLAAHSEHGLKVGSTVAAVAPFFVLFYMLTTTSLMQRFWRGQPVGWWCALLCMWCAIQLLVGLGVLGAVIAQGKAKPKEEV